MSTRIDVALILWNPDVIQLVSLVLRHQNLRSRGVEPSQGADEIQDLIVSGSPSVVVFDLKPPYYESAAFVLSLAGRFPDPSFVITCADPVLALKAAPWLCCYPILQKPYEPDEICEAVRSMVRRRRVNSPALEYH
jgi:DNA-binding NtrC family response regulator